MIIPGGIGTGKDNIGVPVMNGLVSLISARFDLTVFSLARVNDDYVAEGFEIVSIPYSNPFLGAIRFLICFARHHRKKKFVAVHGFWVLPPGLLAMIAGKIFGIQSVISILGGDAAGLPELNYGRLHKPLHRWLVMFALNHANEVNALTKYLVNNLRSAGLERPVDIIPWGVDGSRFDYHPKPLAHPTRFLHIANLHPVKDQETLLRAFALISKAIPCSLTIVGSGNEREKVLRLIRDLDLTELVTIQEPVPYSDLPAFYHAADILLHTSRSEGQCEVVTEAMSCGLPVCGTRVGLLYDLPECGVVVNVRDHSALAGEVLRLVADPLRIDDMRIKAHRWTSEHDIHWTATRLMESYR